MLKTLIAILTPALAVFLILTFMKGCFSMSAVPPPDGLAQIAEPSGHDSASYSPSVPPAIESEWGADAKFVLLHPLINGRDIGWFIFDTGASGCTITADAASAAALSPIGSTPLQNDTMTTVFRADELRLGPLLLRAIKLTGINMSSSSLAFGRPVVGILGRDITSVAIVELDGPARAVRLHAPGSPPPPSTTPHSIEMIHALPHLRCDYAGNNRGLFILDTGADAGIHFFDHAVQHAALLTSPSVTITSSRTQITLGSRAKIREGSIADFRIDARQYAPARATFAEPNDVPSAMLNDADGLIGMRLLNRFDVFIDEPAARIYVAEPPPPKH